MTCVVIFSIKDGKIIGKDNFLMSGTGDTLPNKILSVFLKQYNK